MMKEYRKENEEAAVAADLVGGSEKFPTINHNVNAGKPSNVKVFVFQASVSAVCWSLRYWSFVSLSMNGSLADSLYAG